MVSAIVDDSGIAQYAGNVAQRLRHNLISAWATLRLVAAWYLAGMTS